MPEICSQRQNEKRLEHCCVCFKRKGHDGEHECASALCGRKWDE